MTHMLSALALAFAHATATPVSSIPLSTTCGDLPGVEAMLDVRSLNYVLVGEYHGTVEMPRIAADAMCAAAKRGRPVVLGIEFTTANQSSLETYIRSKGDAAARTALLAAPAWQGDDARASQAVFELIEQARVLVMAGKRVSIVAFDRVPEPAVSREREAALAEALVAARARVSGSLVVALTGSGHAGKTPWSSQNPPFPSTGQLITDGETIALAFARPGGQFFGCRAPNGDATAGCTAYDMPAREPVRARGIVLDGTLREGFEGVYSSGAAYTASRPARLAMAAGASVPK
ncbi:MAG: hypothetical protein IBJ03_10515 [Gemmatimonadaceae bacterium]|nr:hypothetical protein [Gemmatimonadaceae bacterium]